MSTKAAYEKKLQAQLDEFAAEIKRLKERVDKAEADAEPWHQKQIDILQELHIKAMAKLDELDEAGDDAWEDLKESITTAWDEVAKALKSATKRFD